MLAVQTEIPLVKQHLSDQLWAVRGEGAHGASLQPADRRARAARAAAVDAPRASRTASRRSRGSFPARATSSPRSTRRSCCGALGPARAGKAHCFEDQYASTGGQLYELMAGHDRFIADLRPLLGRLLAERGLPPALAVIRTTSAPR